MTNQSAICAHGKPTELCDKCNQYALGYKAGLDAAVNLLRSVSKLMDESEAKTVIEGFEAAIAALPVPEVQCDVNELLDVLQEAVDGMGGSYATWSPKARAVIAKFKEKQL